jgi:hypothetical protein
MATTLDKPGLDLQKYSDDGYLILRRFFDPADVTLVLEEAKVVFDIQCREVMVRDMFELFEHDMQRFIYCGKQVQHLINLHKLSMQDRVVQLLRDIGFGFPNICTRPVIYFNHHRLATKKIYHTVDAHQDWRSMQGSSNAAVIWCPLVDCNIELGALQILPGSHKKGLLTSSIVGGFGMVDVPEGAEWRNLECRVGDAVIFHSMLVHQSGQHTNNDIRWSAHFRYNDLNDSAFIERGFVHPYIYKPVDELL